MRRRAWIGAGVGVLAIAGALALWDALVVTDEERLEAFIDDVAGPLTPAGVRAARGRWVDLEREPLELSALGRSELFRAGELDALLERADGGLASVYGSSLTVLSHGIDVEGDEATITMRVMSQRLGMMNATWDFARHGDDWLLERAVIRR